MSIEKSIKSLKSKSRLVLPFADFITLLESNGFVIGVDNYLSLQTLLNKIDSDCPQPRLKKYIRPIFCTTAEQQEKFDRLFDDYFNENLPRVARTTDRQKKAIPQYLIPKEEVKESNLIKNILISLLALIGILLILTFFGDKISLDSIFNNSQPESPNLDEPGPQNINSYLIPLSLVLIGIIISIGGFWLYKRSRKKESLALDMDRLRKPMLYWKIDVPETKLNLFSSHTFFNTTRLLKSRELSEVRFLDISKTIKATIENAGFPKFKYGFRTKFPEYLILIDKASFRDHQANYFETLFQSLNEQEIYAERYYFRNTPDRCWDENNKGIQLEELFRKYQIHRLVIMGDLIDLFDPMNGKLKQQLIPLLFWRYKAILTTTDPAAKFVSALSEYGDFITAKATIENLLNLQEAIQVSDQISYSSGTSNTRSYTSLQHLSDEQIIQKLKLQVDRTTFNWLCVCAVYPELNWPFTLYLGKQVLGNLELTENRIMDLVQLPWFREGQFPEKLRGQLINQLPEDLLRKTRQVIFDWMRENPPQVDDVKSNNEYQLFIAMEAAMLDPNDPEKQRWLQKQLSKPESQGSPYREIVLHYLEKQAKKNTTLNLPEWMNNLFGVGEKLENNFIFPKAHLTNRIYAKLIDWGIIYFAILVVIVFQAYLLASVNVNVGVYSFLFSLSLFYIFPVIIEGVLGGLGKNLMKLQVLSLFDGEKSNLKTAVLRHLNILIIIGVGFLFYDFGSSELSDENTITVYSVSYLLGSQVGQFINVFAYAGVLILLNILIDTIYIYYSKSGQHFLDRLAGAQVVNHSDISKGRRVDYKKEPVEKTASELKLYPKVKVAKRLWAKLIDWGIIIIVISFINGLLLNFIVSGDISINQMLAYSVPLSYLLIVIIDSSKLIKGIGKRAMGLTVVDVKRGDEYNYKSLIRYLNVAFYSLAWLFINLYFGGEDNFVLDNLANSFLALIVVNSILDYFIINNSKTGQHFLDQLAGTQVVYKTDFLATKKSGQTTSSIPSSKLSPESDKIFLYPKVDLDKKVMAEVIDYFAVFLVIGFLATIFGVIEGFADVSIMDTTSFMIFVFLVLFLFKISIDSILKGIGKRQMKILSVEINTNQPMSIGSSFLKHIGLLIFFIALMILVILDSSEVTYSIFWASVIVLLVLGFLQSVLSKTGRSLMDKLAGTQEVNGRDFLSGNYEGNTEYKTPEFVESTLTEQLPHDENPVSKSEVEQFTFYSEDEIYKKVIDLTGFGPDKLLLIFKTRKQQTWLVSVGNEIICLLDDAKTRANEKRLLQWRYELKPGEELYVKAKKSRRTKRSGLIDIGNRRNWLYSFSLHPDKEKFEEDIKGLLTYEEAAISGSSVENSILENEDKSFEQSRVTRTFKIFIASTSDVSEDLKALEVSLSRKHKTLLKEDIQLEIFFWSDHLNKMNVEGFKETLTTKLEDCDMVIFLFGRSMSREINNMILNMDDFVDLQNMPKVLIYFEKSKTDFSFSKMLIQFRLGLDDKGWHPSGYKNSKDLFSKVDFEIENELKSNY